MESMTGYGLGRAPLGAGRVEIEIRAVNHRYLEVRWSTPTEAAAHVHVLDREIRTRCHRGRYDVAVRLEGSTPLAARLDIDRAREVYGELAALRDELAPDTALPVDVIASLPDLFTATGEVDAEQIETGLLAAFDAAFDALRTMRRTEGEALRGELEACLGRLDEHRKALSERSAGAVERQRTRLRDRLERLLADVDVELEPGRLETEIALLADKSDVTEELARLDSHLSQLESMIASDEPVGRRIDFLLQEINREVNTLGAKSQDAETAQRIVEAKSEIEKMRQQVANVA
jgi:uncharacterized protein (TIGR00255 family)